jgi:hypothetical protein
LALAVSAAPALTSAAAQAQSERPAPSLDQPKKYKLAVDTGKQQQIWAAVMKTVGPYDNREKCWTLEVRGRRFCMQPAKLAMRGGADHIDYYFAISGKEYQPDALKTGVVMFMSFSSGGADKSFTFRDLDGLYEFGSRKTPSADKDFRFVDVAIDTYAWEVTDTLSGIGSELETTTLIHIGGVFTPKLRRMADFVTYKGNESSCGGEKQSLCASNKIDYAFKAGAGGFYALEMTLRRKSGSKEIFALGDASPVVQSEPVTVPFDSKEGRYKLPSADMVDWLSRKMPPRVAANP